MSQAFDSIKDDEETYLLKTYARYPLAIDHGKGSASLGLRRQRIH